MAWPGRAILAEVRCRACSGEMGWRAPGDGAVGFEHAVISSPCPVSRMPAVCVTLPSGRLVTADESHTVEQLQAELRQLRGLYESALAEVATHRAEDERRDRALAEALEQ